MCSDDGHLAAVASTLTRRSAEVMLYSAAVIALRTSFSFVLWPSSFWTLYHVNVNYLSNYIEASNSVRYASCSHSVLYFCCAKAWGTELLFIEKCIIIASDILSQYTGTCYISVYNHPTLVWCRYRWTLWNFVEMFWFTVAIETKQTTMVNCGW